MHMVHGTQSYLSRCAHVFKVSGMISTIAAVLVGMDHALAESDSRSPDALHDEVCVAGF